MLFLLIPILVTMCVYKDIKERFAKPSIENELLRLFVITYSMVFIYTIYSFLYSMLDSLNFCCNDVYIVISIVFWIPYILFGAGSISEFVNSVHKIKHES